MAKVALIHAPLICWLVAGMALGAGEGVNILIVVVALLARHLQGSPDRFRKAWLLIGNLFFTRFLFKILLHDYLLSERMIRIAILHRISVYANRSYLNFKIYGFVKSWQKCRRFVQGGRVEG